MADNIGDLLDDNEKAAGILLVQLEAAKSMIHHINKTFFTPLKFTVFEGSSYHLLDAFGEVVTRLNTEQTEFKAKREKLSENFRHIQAKIKELDVRAEDVDDQLTNLWDVIRTSVENLNEITKTKFEQADEQEEVIFDNLQDFIEHIYGRQKTSGLMMQQLHEKMEQAETKVTELKGMHDGAVAKLDESLVGASAELKTAFQELAEGYMEQDNLFESSLEEIIVETQEALRKKLAEDVPDGINVAGEGLVLGGISELIDSATEAHENIAGKLGGLLEKIQEVAQAANDVKPTLNTIESIA